MTDDPKALLDVGCGTRLVSRNLMEFVDRVEGANVSENLIETAHILQIATISVSTGSADR